MEWPRPLLAAIGIAGTLGLAGAAGAVSPLETRWSGELLRSLDSLHLDADALDPEDFTDKLMGRSRAGASDAAVGERLGKMLEMGQSRRWPEALQAVTGETRIDGGALLEYFAPLRKWLDDQDHAP